MQLSELLGIQFGVQAMYNKIVKESLDELVNVAKTSKNLMPQLITCVENNCTLGEIIIALKTVFGEYLE